jgi:PAS domain S-box-containing protein
MPSQPRSKPGGKGRGKSGKALSKKSKNSLELKQRPGKRIRELETEKGKFRNPINERKRSDEALRESEERYRALVETSPDAIVVHRDGRFIYANPAALRLYGVGSFEELEGKSVLEFSHPDDREEIAVRVKQAAEGATVPLQGTRVIRLDGQQVFIEAAAGPIHYKGAPAVQAIVRDITDRKRAEEATLRAKQQWERTFDAVPDLIAILDGTYRILRVNRAMSQRLGLTQDQCVGKVCHKAIHGLDSPPDFCPHTLTLADGREHVAEVHEDSLGGDFLVTTTPLTDEHGSYIGSVHVARDITSRKQMEKTLSESQKDLNHAQAVARTGSWRMDVQRNELRWSDETHRIFGVPKETPLTYETFLAAIHPDDRNFVDQKWKAAMRGEPYDIQHRIVIGTEIKWVREIAEMEFDPQGRLLGGFGIIHDFTRRKQAEESLRESEARYRSLFDHMLDGFAYCQMLYDEHSHPEDFVYLAVNDAFGRLTGLEDVIGKRVTQVIPGIKELTPELFEIYGRVALTGNPERFQIDFKPLGLYLSVSAYSPAKGYFVAVFDNITERKRAEEALRQRTAELQQLNETLEERVRKRTGELASLSSELLVAQEKERRRISQDLHDKIWQALELIKLEIEDLFFKEQGAVSATFHEKSKKIKTFIRETVARVRSVQGDLWPPVLDDIGVLATINWYSREFQNSHAGITIERHIDLEEEDVPAPVKIVIYRVMQEAMNNVAKHSHASQVFLSLVKHGRRLEFTVQDNGVGFDPEEVIVKRSPWGGLGLLSMKERTELSGGRFNVESVRGNGTTVRASWS